MRRVGNQAAELIQRRWRQYRQAVEAYEVDAAVQEPSPAHPGAPPADRAGAGIVPSGAAAGRIQRCWRAYRCAVVNAELEDGEEQEESNAGRETPADDDIPLDTTPTEEELEAAARIQARWRRSRQGSLPSRQGSSHHSVPQGAGVPDATSDAVRRIQRRWKRYREALAVLDDVESTIHASEVASVLDADDASSDAAVDDDGDLPLHQVAAAAALIQRRWRQYQHAAERAGEHAFDGQDGTTAERPPPSAVATSAAALRIQRRWRQYREAVDDYEDVASTAAGTNHGEVLSEAAETIQRRWRAYVAATSQPERNSAQGDPGPPVADEQSAKPAPERESMSSSSVTSSDEDASSDDDIIDEDALGANNVDSDADGADGAADASAVGARHAHALQRVLAQAQQRQHEMAPHDAAAVRLQWWWRVRRGRGDEVVDSPAEASAAAAVQPPVGGREDASARRHRAMVEALAAIQHIRARAAFRPVMDATRRRDREQAAARLQELWRRRRAIQQHRANIVNGQRENAALSIQQAFRRRRHGARDAHGAGDESDATAASAIGATLPRADAGDSSTPCGQALPQCVVCLDEVVQVALLPCGHAHLCTACADALRRCPCCRVLVAVRLRIFL